MPQSAAWPRISVVTPSFQQAPFLEETLRSVLLQGYPDLEYWVVDGGSTDGSVEVIKRYAPWLAGWVSEKDRGQTEAINKGWKQCTGGIRAYINSDDGFRPDALATVARAFEAHPDARWLVGHSVTLEAQTDREVDFPVNLPPERWRWLLHNNFTPQPSTFVRGPAADEVGLFDEDYHRSMDQEYWLRFIVRGWMPLHVPETLAFFRFHPNSKTRGKDRARFFEEDLRALRKHVGRLPEEDRRKALAAVPGLERMAARLTAYDQLPRGRRPVLKEVARLVRERPDHLWDRGTWGLLRRLATRGSMKALAREMGVEEPEG